LDLGVIMMASLMLVGVFRRAALSRATLQRQSLFSLHRSSRPPAPLSLHFSTSARLRIQRGPEPGHVTAKEQRRKDWMVVRRLIGNVWPKHDWNTRFRVVLGFALLLGGKVLNVHVPQLFKDVIDALNLDVSATSTVWVVAGSLILGYGAARIGATVFGELLNAVFANIGQRAIRKVSRETFEHLLNLNLKFHLSRQTGGLTRAIDRGTKGITFMLQAILFRIAPTALEISMVCGILVCVVSSPSASS
jgi:ATP-binding cassette subfamily B (MDR/TAP) protein 7